MAMPIVDIEYTDVACIAFFGNLLFEGQELDRVVAVHNVDRDDVAGLLYHLGIDCPGAVSITPQGAGPGKRPGQFPQDYEEITEERLTAMVASLHFKGRLPDGSRDPSPVAGVQPKIAVTYIDDKFYLPLKDSRAPTTHILKVSPKDDTQITKHEAAILSIARQVGIDTTECTRMVFKDEETCADIETILSTRFDRTIKTIDGNIEIRRIHSEDFCQALGLPRNLKYERNSVDPSRKFSMAAVGKLSSATSKPIAFKMEFLRHILFNLIVGNTDNHAKNAAIIYNGVSGDLAPLYDVVPVFVDTKVTHEFSINIGDAKFAEDLNSAEIQTALRQLGFKAKGLTNEMRKLVEKIVSQSIGILLEEDTKIMADAMAAQIHVIHMATGWPDVAKPRDFYPRQERDQNPETHGWPTME